MQSWGKLVKKIWKILREVQPLIYYCMSNKQDMFFLSCLCLRERWFREVAEQVVGTTKRDSCSVLFLITVFLAHQVPQPVGSPLLLYLRRVAVNRTTSFTDSGNQGRTKQKSDLFSQLKSELSVTRMSITVLDRCRSNCAFALLNFALWYWSTCSMWLCYTSFWCIFLTLCFLLMTYHLLCILYLF